MMRTAARPCHRSDTDGRACARRARTATMLCGLALALLSPGTIAAAAPEARVKPLCAAPAPGHAGCLALRLLPAAGSPSARAITPNASAALKRAGIHPSKLTSAYALPASAAEPQTLAIVDAYDDPTIEADLEVFDQEFELPACTTANGCFAKVNGQGNAAPLPAVNGGWAGEIATDVEVAHGLCPNCRIVLVEASSSSYVALETAEQTAAAKIEAASQPGHLEGEISNSWGGGEPPFDNAAFDHPGIPITVSSGDDGYLQWDEYATREQEGSAYFEGPNYPASSPHVVAVGGTSLTVNASGEWAGEHVWNDASGAGGGGCSEHFAAQPWQSAVAGWASVGCGSMRAVADVSADADPVTGVSVYDSTPESSGEEAPGWIVVGGTSVASPIVASVFALAGGAHGVAYPAQTLYANAGGTGLHDVTAGGNGECNGVYTSCSGSLVSPLDCGQGARICNAAAGYDGATGVGSPNGIGAFQPAAGGSEGEGKKGEGESKESEGEEKGAEGEGTKETGGGGGGSGGGQEGAGGGSPGGGQTSGGTQSGSGSTGAPGGTGATTGGPILATAASQPGGVRLSGLALSFAAIVALNRPHPRASALAFSFTLNAPARVRVTLAKRVRSGARGRWRTLPGAFTITAAAGRGHGRLGGRRTLAAGRYRLTLTPAHGSAQSIVVVIG